jgi:hypothetical protein
MRYLLIILCPDFLILTIGDKVLQVQFCPFGEKNSIRYAKLKRFQQDIGNTFAPMTAKTNMDARRMHSLAVIEDILIRALLPHMQYSQVAPFKS